MGVATKIMDAKSDNYGLRVDFSESHLLDSSLNIVSPTRYEVNYDPSQMKIILENSLREFQENNRNLDNSLGQYRVDDKKRLVLDFHGECQLLLNNWEAGVSSKIREGVIRHEFDHVRQYADNPTCAVVKNAARIVRFVESLPKEVKSSMKDCIEYNNLTDLLGAFHTISEASSMIEEVTVNPNDHSSSRENLINRFSILVCGYGPFRWPNRSFGTVFRDDSYLLLSPLKDYYYHVAMLILLTQDVNLLQSVRGAEFKVDSRKTMDKVITGLNLILEDHDKFVKNINSPGFKETLNKTHNRLGSQVAELYPQVLDLVIKKIGFFIA